MHIPDGYLSPSTCASLYGAAAPFWYTAARRVRQVLNARTVPMLALFSALSFVVMMFNLPLPGGTTGHAVGVGMASILLGPWVSICAISAALLIQALLFGDGGITTYGANCFNMAIVGSLVAYGVYRAVSAGADLRSGRRVFAAGLAGYTAINAAALCAAIEFGIQPALFHSPSGAPLYAPYPLSVSIPAMMLGHLTFAGLAEMLLTAGVVRFLQASDPAVLQRPAMSRGAARRLWAAAALAVVLTPLGIIAVGNAWGEWSARDFDTQKARLEMAAASGGALPPGEAPSGMKHYSNIWAAPLAGYAPKFIPNAPIGYAVSAAIGCIILVGSLYLAARFAARGIDKRRQSFAAQTLAALVRMAGTYFEGDAEVRPDTPLAQVDARAKLAGFAILLITAIALRHLQAVGAAFAIAVVIALLAGASPRMLVLRVWLPVLAFTGVIALPSVFLVPGTVLWRTPFGAAVTEQGLASAAFLLLRASTAATLSAALILSTPWTSLLRALRSFGVPRAAVLTLQMAHRYAFVLIRSAEEMLESREARTVGELTGAEQRRIAASTAGALLDKSLKLSEEIFDAMQARGFTGDVYVLEQSRFSASSVLAVALTAAASTILLWSLG